MKSTETSVYDAQAAGAQASRPDSGRAGGERVIVVGAGIAGLAAAFRLQQAGFEVRVLESADHVGGRMWTIEHEGYLIDTGATALSARYKQMVQLAHDAGLSGEMQPSTNVIGFLRDGQVHRLRTTHRIDGLRTGLLSARGKASMANAVIDLARSWRSFDVYDLGKAADIDDENLYDYAMRRLGPEALEYIVEPAATALSFGSARDMSKVGFLWAMRRVFGGAFFSSPNGNGFLCAGLARQLDVVLGARVQAVEEVAGGVRVGWDGGVEEASAAVIALPAPAMAQVYPQLDPMRREIVGEIKHSSSLHVHFGLGSVPAEPSVMVMSPPALHEGLCFTGFDHHKAPGRAPAGKGLIGTYWHADWTQEHWPDDDEQVVAAARDTTAGTFPGLLDDVEMTHVTRVDTCVVVNHAGLCRRQAQFTAATDPKARIQLAGDYFSCSSTNTSLCLGERAAQRLVRVMCKSSREEQASCLSV